MHIKKTLAIALITISILCFATVAYTHFYRTAAATITSPNGTKINVELADTPAKQARGLMFRRQLAQDSGMLFTFNEVGRHIFWMKNTYIPLDIIWLDGDLTIVDIKENVPPCKSGERCPLYMPDGPAKYVLEVNAGLSEKWDLQVGANLKLNNYN